MERAVYMRDVVLRDMLQLRQSCDQAEAILPSDSANYCSLERILVGTHEANPTMDQCTDCKSFQMK